MQVDTVQAPLAAGLVTRLPQDPSSAGRIENWTVDQATGGWSSRVGYESFVPAATTWAPFSSCGPVYSLHVAQALAGGARQHVLFEEQGNLHLLYDAAGTPVLRTLATGRHVPTVTEAASWYTDTPHGTVITNGFDRPVIVKPWPLAGIVDAANTITQCIRPLGFDGLPTAVTPRNVKPVPAPPFPPNIRASGNGAVTLWCPSNGNAIPAGGVWGLGFSNNAAGQDGDKESKYGYAMSFVTDSGSEGPVSTLSSVAWGLDAGAEGFKHATAVTIPTGPRGTVARKLYRTTNYSDDYDFPGDTRLYLVELIRNNVDTIYFDAAPTALLGQPAPDIATGPLPAPRARFSAIWNGVLWLDGGLEDSRTLYYSAQGLIEQFAADAFVELAAQGGSITALYAHYTSLLVFRENGVDVVQGDAQAGFTVTTLSSSVTCRAPHSLATVPGLGVVFLALDGVYAVTGGLQGGATNDLVKLTTLQEQFIGRITADAFPKAVATWSAQDQEYTLFVPTLGNDRPDTGLVLHVDRLQAAPDTSPWSNRKGFPVGAVSTFFGGAVVFGHHTGNQDSAPESERGLFVLSGKRALGRVLVDNQLVSGPTPTSVYRSAWSAFGDPQTQKQVAYVTVWMLTTGNQKITMRHYKDFSLQVVEERTYFAQPPDASALATLDKSVLNQAVYRDERLVPLRFAVAHQGCSWFCFELETQEDLILVGWEYGYTSKGTQTVMGVRA
jgi:hypothetical protein